MESGLRPRRVSIGSERDVARRRDCGDPWAGSAPGETYAYDADGYRFLRLSLDNAGKALLSVRDGEGRTLSEFVDEPSGGLKLARDFVYGVGQLLVERQVTSAPPQLLLGSPLVSGGSYHLTVTDGSAAPSYELDIRTASGFQNRLTGLQRDAAQQVHVPESALSPGETKVLRLGRGRAGDGLLGAGLAAVRSQRDALLPDQIRALGVAQRDRPGAALGAADGKQQEHQGELPAGRHRSDLRADAASAGVVHQVVHALVASAGLAVRRLPAEPGAADQRDRPDPAAPHPEQPSGTQGTEIHPCDDPPPDPAPGPRFTNAYHHRDHLGTLRNVTGDGGYLAAAYDWYPYGTRMATGATSAPEDSRRVFTGHERDLATGLDYMIARYYSPTQGTFLSVDPGNDTDLDDPQSWSAYSYVRRDPLGGNDPDGRFGNFLVGFVVGAAVEAGSQVVAGSRRERASSIP